MWHEDLEEASRLYFGEHNIEGLLKVLKLLHEMLEEGSTKNDTTIREKAFIQVTFSLGTYCSGILYCEGMFTKFPHNDLFGKTLFFSDTNTIFGQNFQGIVLILLYFSSIIFSYTSSRVGSTHSSSPFYLIFKV